MKKLLSFLVAAVVVASCSITQEYSFNKDFSGTYALKFDVSQLAEVGGGDNPDSIPNFFEEMDLDSIADLYKNIEGISNVKVSEADNILYVNYNFKNLEALNKSLETSSTESTMGMKDTPKFSYQNNTFRYAAGDMSTFAENDSLAEMLSFLDYTITMKFAKKIEKASNGEMQEDGKSIVMSGNFGEVAKTEKAIEVEVTFDK